MCFPCLGHLSWILPSLCPVDPKHLQTILKTTCGASGVGKGLIHIGMLFSLVATHHSTRSHTSTHLPPCFMRDHIGRLHQKMCEDWGTQMLLDLQWGSDPINPSDLISKITLDIPNLWSHMLRDFCEPGVGHKHQHEARFVTECWLSHGISGVLVSHCSVGCFPWGLLDWPGPVTAAT
jgi:hypothetical protein